MKADPAKGCNEIGSVSGYCDITQDEGICKNDMRNRAAKMGANFVRLETVTADPNVNRKKLSGSAYKCPSK